MGGLVKPGAGAGGSELVRDRIVVWIDSREARIARRHGEVIELERLASDVPPHSGAGGHVRHDPTMRHGGGAGDPQSAAERRRIEHLEAFLAEVEARLPPDADIELVGPGTVHERLAREIRQADVRHRRERIVAHTRSGRITEPQLIARLRPVRVSETVGDQAPP
ncbi:MAG TPA: hypothetical protein VJ506_06010 [Candidatus Limnocylindrales bacterium]|nr:hypothetical protein [Candidatus Limnocylindrales bacterium]